MHCNSEKAASLHEWGWVVFWHNKSERERERERERKKERKKVATSARWCLFNNNKNTEKRASSSFFFLTIMNFLTNEKACERDKKERINRDAMGNMIESYGVQQNK
jgi:hypothetical protein